MSQSFPFSFFFLGFPLHTFSLINPIFSLSTHHLPIKHTTNIYTIIDFPIESKLLSIQQLISRVITYLSKIRLFSPHQNIQLPSFGFITHRFNFLYIDFESLFEVTKLQLELESLFEVSFFFFLLLNFFALLMQFLWFVVCITFFPPHKLPNYN